MVRHVYDKYCGFSNMFYVAMFDELEAAIINKIPKELRLRTNYRHLITGEVSNGLYKFNVNLDRVMRAGEYRDTLCEAIHNAALKAEVASNAEEDFTHGKIHLETMITAFDGHPDAGQRFEKLVEELNRRVSDAPSRGVGELSLKYGERPVLASFRD